VLIDHGWLRFLSLILGSRRLSCLSKAPAIFSLLFSLFKMDQLSVPQVTLSSGQDTPRACFYKALHKEVMVIIIVRGVSNSLSLLTGEVKSC
jgi:hypothetical protein